MRANSTTIALSKAQIEMLCVSPDTDTLTGLRDTAIFRLMLATGVREQEAAALTVSDLYQYYDGLPALDVQHGKGNKQRKVPYGELREWAIPYVELWLENAGITEGYVFRSLWKDDSLREGMFHRTTIGYILARYPIKHHGQLYTVTPHDLRYTYARRCHDAGMSVEAISRNMGHVKQDTTMRYIGDIDARRREPKQVYK